MLHAHPRIDNDTIRVRFADYGPSSLDISLRVYALTRDWNEFHAIREDVFLRIKQIVEGSGTRFAIPSQTLYMTRDNGLDAARSAQADAEVARPGGRPAPCRSHALRPRACKNSRTHSIIHRKAHPNGLRPGPGRGRRPSLSRRRNPMELRPRRLRFIRQALPITHRKKQLQHRA